ncbi:RlmE family RNA methyltransferase [Pelagibacterium luteolum]|uniref:Ribosomal RNA large subunit methyltransferase E n=1 Tax=Pelagibacterium luteolum TaxID=440168 RepID=A0A1G7ZJG1_9HYPH|nr:RlmE family RNA methyltransferase [Pelagibacterium luteolum]SDH08755.1 23S rRNA (uridine2552-2'-O)-methyltransferase [Pelagibacterium luteolum]
MPNKPTGKGSGRRGDRDLKTRVKTARKRTTSSTLWLQRQLNDPYVARARAEGWRARSAYKLLELDEKYELLKPGMRVVDLGAAPGGWCQVAVKAVKSDPENPSVVGIDYLEMDPVPGAVLLQKDFTEDDAPQALFDLLGGHKADIVLSDMAAPTTGHKPTDHLRIIALVEIAADFALDVLAPGGTFIAKVFQGGTEHELLGMLKRNFASTFHAKPPSSRAESAETYLVARGFKGQRQD